MWEAAFPKWPTAKPIIPRGAVSAGGTVASTSRRGYRRRADHQLIGRACWRPQMKIIQAQIHLALVRCTSCGRIPTKDQIIFQPRPIRRMTSRLDDQQFVLCEVWPSMRVGCAQHHLINCESFRPSQNIRNFPEPTFLSHQQLAVQKGVRFLIHCAEFGRQ